MRDIAELLIHFLLTLAKLLKPGGMKRVMAETMATQQQLIIMNRGKKRAPKLTSFDRFFLWLMAVFTGENAFSE